MHIASPETRPYTSSPESNRLTQEGYGTLTVICPGLVIVITPPHVHINVEGAFSAGLLPIMTVGEPGAHGAVVTGIQGCGVNTPIAADVAAAT
jgi:hypothetical protein